jgi:hypothetical protein
MAIARGAASPTSRSREGLLVSGNDADEYAFREDEPKDPATGKSQCLEHGMFTDAVLYSHEGRRRNQHPDETDAGQAQVPGEPDKFSAADIATYLPSFDESASAEAMMAGLSRSKYVVLRLI